MDWDDLRSFLAIARAGTLSAAARRLGVRQSTMGRRLAALEARAGVRLLERTPRGFRLTPAGEAARAEVERMETAALAVERAGCAVPASARRSRPQCEGDDGGVGEKWQASQRSGPPQPRGEPSIDEIRQHRKPDKYQREQQHHSLDDRNIPLP